MQISFLVARRHLNITWMSQNLFLLPLNSYVDKTLFFVCLRQWIRVSSNRVFTFHCRTPFFRYPHFVLEIMWSRHCVCRFEDGWVTCWWNRCARRCGVRGMQLSLRWPAHTRTKLGFHCITFCGDTLFFFYVNTLVFQATAFSFFIEEHYSFAIRISSWARHVIPALSVPFWGWLGHLLVELLCSEMRCLRDATFFEVACRHQNKTWISLQRFLLPLTKLHCRHALLLLKSMQWCFKHVISDTIFMFECRREMLLSVGLMILAAYTCESCFLEECSIYGVRKV